MTDAAPKKPRKTKAAPAIAPFEDLDAGAIEALLGKIAKAGDSFDATQLLRKAAGDDRDRADRLLAHLLENDLLSVSLTTVEMVRELARFAVPVGSARGFVKLVERLPQALKKYVPKKVQVSLLLPEWDSSMQHLAAYALLHEREALLAAFPRLKGTVKTGVAFTLGLSGVEIDAAMKREVAQALAAMEETRSRDDWPPRVEGWTVKTFKPSREELAALFGTVEVAAATPGKFGDFIAGYRHIDKLLMLRDDPKPLLRKLVARGESPEEVFAVARGLSANDDERGLRETLLVWAIPRLAGLSLEHLQELTFFLRNEQYVALFAGLPREIALAFVKAKLDAARWSDEGIPLSAVLVTHFDAELFARYLEVTQGGSTTMAALGVQALPALVRFILEHRTPEHERLAASGAILSPGFAVMEILSLGKGPLDPIEQQAVDALGLSLLQFGQRGRGTPSSFNAAMLRRLPEPLRISLLRNALRTLAAPAFAFALVGTVRDAAFRLEAARFMLEKRETIEPYDDFDEGARAVGPEVLAEAARGAAPLSAALLSRIEGALYQQGFKRFSELCGLAPQSWLDKLRAVAAETSGPTTRVYLLETASRAAEAGVSPRPGSLSCIGDADSDLVLTIDLADVPPLAHDYPGATAISFFAEGKNAGLYETARLVPGAAAGAEPLVIIPLEIPDAMFVKGEGRGLLRRTSGWVLGEPIGVQDAPAGVGFVMQLHERLGLNCGDAGAVYVFRDHVEMQSC